MKQISDDEVPHIGRDPDLLEAFYREHSARIRSFLTRRVADPHLVADLTADVFLAAIDDAERKRARRLRAESRIVGRRLLDEDTIGQIEDRIQAERTTRALCSALATLPHRDRRLMELVAVDGLTMAEAAEELGVKPATARVRLHRSRARLRNHLNDHSLFESTVENQPVLTSKEASS